MSRLKANGSYYELQEFLGEGLTSQVYKAFRIDCRGYTKQPVALKLVKSKKHVQILRNEFEKLQRVDSQNCVKVYGWENLEQGPALVLELLEGVTLHEIYQSEVLNANLVEEILAQLQIGLKAIHQRGLVHGDLNLKNIFISPEGNVKLLDFGFLVESKEKIGTPQFLAPEVWEGLAYTAQSDLFSLGLIREYLLDPLKSCQIDSRNWQSVLSSDLNKNIYLRQCPTKRGYLQIDTEPKRKSQLGEVVKSCLLKRKNMGTIILKKPKRKTKNSLFVGAIFTWCFTFLPMWPQNAEWSHFQVRSHRWVTVSINEMAQELDPINKKQLRAGTYTIQWEGDQGRVEKTVKLKPKETFILKPESINL